NTVKFFFGQVLALIGQASSSREGKDQVGLSAPPFSSHAQGGAGARLGQLRFGEPASEDRRSPFVIEQRPPKPEALLFILGQPGRFQHLINRTVKVDSC